MTEKTFFDYSDPSRKKPEKPSPTVLEDKHVATLRAIEKYSRPVQKGLDDLKIEYDINRKTRVVLALFPEWDPSFPPYNIAKLSSAVKNAGYFCKSYDFNAEAWNYYKTNFKDKIHFDPWDPLRDWHWVKDQYYIDLHEHLKPFFDKCVKKILSNNPDVLGLSLYYCNFEPATYVASEIKRINSKVKIIVGGSATHTSFFKSHKMFDYVVNGEGEKALLDILHSFENDTEVEIHEENENSKYIRQPEKQRYNLSTLPLPDYSDFDFSLYKFPNGALCEISRGCIAKCTFCEETHFWKYRQRNALSTLNEIEHMYYEHGTNVFWFIDSLVNGNLNELRAFVKGVAEKGLDIAWTGYCRCDGRMDLEYYKDLAAGGCKLLNYGIESGSQKVLNLMDKLVTIEEMEQNFRDGHAVGIHAMTNWIVGFPNEGPKEFEDTLTFMHRMRNYSITHIAQGTGFVVGVDTIVGQNFDKFNLLPFYFYDHWITKDFKASLAHKMIKNKCFSIFTDFLQTNLPCSKPTRPNLAEFHYKINFNDPDRIFDIDYNYDDFDYQIIKPNINPFADSLVNEIWPFLRIMWRTRGGYSLKLIFDKDLDLLEFGKRGTVPLDAEYVFNIDDNGNWDADFKWNFEQEVKPESEFKDHHWTDHLGNEYVAADTSGPVWKIVDFSQGSSNSVVRARKLAWKDDPSKKNIDPANAYKEERFWELSKEFVNIRQLDFSFNYAWQGKGKWNR